MQGLSLTAKKVKVSYNKFSVSDINFSLKSRDIFGLVGRSGSGKSTLIKTLVGLKDADAGQITIKSGGKDVSLRDIVGYSPQDNSLFQYLTVEENLETFGRLHGLDMKQIERMSKFLLERLDLKKSSQKKVLELSGGMKKRADLAVTMIHDPEILILDEPFAGLDVSLQNFIWTLLKEVAQSGKIVILSSHMLGDLRKNCNQIGLIEKGKFYNTQQIIKTMKASKEPVLENFLEKLFKRE